MFTSPSLEIRNASFADSHWYSTLTVCADQERVKDQTYNSPCQPVGVVGRRKSE